MIKKIVKYRLVSLLSLVSILFVVGGFAWSWYSLIMVGSSPLILHFNDIDGITAVGGLGNVILMGILGIFIILINFFLAIALEERDNVMGKILASTTLLMAILLFLAFVAILNVN